MKYILQSKWYWYIPFVTVFFVENMAEWILDSHNASERNGRYLVAACLMILNAVGVACVTAYILKHNQML